jgi:HAD superfamily phosphatase (TIGR01668 family)
MVLEPDLMVDAVFDVSLGVLEKRQVRAVIVDLDDTLVASNTKHLATAYTQWVAALKEAGIPVLILSNGTRKRVAYYTNLLAIKGFALTGKPFFGFRRALKTLGSQPNETMMIGDQLFTDILGAKLVGMQSVLVKPLSSGLLLHTRFLRRLERFMLRGS